MVKEPEPQEDEDEYYDEEYDPELDEIDDLIPGNK